MQAANSGAFVARDSRPRIALRFLASLGFVVLFLWLIGAFGPVPSAGERGRQRVPEWLFAPVGWLCIIYFGATTAGWTKRLFKPRENLTIDRVGIFLRHWSDAIIPWDAIANVAEDNMGSQRFLVLTLHEPDRYPGQGIAGLLAGLNRRLIRGHIAFSLAHTDRSVADAMAAVAAFRPQARPAPMMHAVGPVSDR